MSRRVDHGGRSMSERREFLKGAGITTCAAFLGGGAIGGTAMGDSEAIQKGAHQIAGIDPRNVVDEAKARGLDALSDTSLYRATAAIVSRPPKEGLTSFTLHAPLEAMARYGLLRLVDPAERGLARLQMITSAAAYGAGVNPLAPPARVKPFPDQSTAAAEFARAFEHGDPAGLEALVLQIAAQFGTASLVHLLTPLALPTLTGASHCHIGLWLLLRHGEAADIEDASLLRAAARFIASDPRGRMKSFSGMSIAGGQRLDKAPEEIQREILAKLTNPPRDRPGNASIRGLMDAGERTGNADRLFGDFIRHDLTAEQIDAAFRAVLRVSAHSMLQDDLAQAKFGWTHCLTLPQSACGLSSLNTDRKLALAATLVWITAYRSVLSRRALDFDWKPERVPDVSIREALETSPTVAAARVWYARDDELDDVRFALATAASIRNDIHLVKYTRATFDMGTFDPSHRRLYLAAAAHLCGLWIKETPRDKILNNLLAGRTTP